MSKNHFETLLAYEASAGSGKTFSLVVRYLSLLILGATPRSILALTFTKKAAFEMSHRIIDTMSDLENRQAELNFLCKSLHLSREQIINKISQIREIIEYKDLKISTIDSFFSNVLRLFSFYASLMPDFDIVSHKNLDQIDMDFLKRVKQKGMYDALIEFALRFDKSQQEIFGVLDDLYQKGGFRAVQKGISSHIDTKDILKKVSLIQDIFRHNGISQKGYDTFEVKDIDQLMSKSFLAKESLNYWIYKKAYVPKVDEIFKEIKDMLKSYLNSHESYILDHFKALFDVYKECRDDHLSRESSLTFAEVSLKTKDILSSIDSEFLYFRLDSVIDHILIDEFQDTNIQQYEILRPLIDEISSGLGSTEFKSFFYVVKQQLKINFILF